MHKLNAEHLIDILQVAKRKQLQQTPKLQNRGGGARAGACRHGARRALPQVRRREGREHRWLRRADQVLSETLPNPSTSFP